MSHTTTWLGLGISNKNIQVTNTLFGIMSEGFSCLMWRWGVQINKFVTYLHAKGSFRLLVELPNLRLSLGVN